MKFDVHTIWARYPGAEDAVWCVDAWDESSIDENGAGWQEAVEKARAANDEVRIVVVKITHEDVVAAFQPARTEGEVVR